MKENTIEEEFRCNTMDFPYKYPSKYIGLIIALLNTKECPVEHIMVIPKYPREDVWEISVYEPKCWILRGNPPLEEDKQELMDIFNNEWKDLIELYEYGCENGCDEDKYKCKHYLNRIPLPESPPDYMNLKNMG